MQDPLLFIIDYDPYWIFFFFGRTCCFHKILSSDSREKKLLEAPLQALGYSAGAPSFEGGDPTYIVECSSSSVTKMSRNQRVGYRTGWYLNKTGIFTP